MLVKFTLILYTFHYFSFSDVHTCQKNYYYVTDQVLNNSSCIISFNKNVGVPFVFDRRGSDQKSKKCWLRWVVLMTSSHTTTVLLSCYYFLRTFMGQIMNKILKRSHLFKNKGRLPCKFPNWNGGIYNNAVFQFVKRLSFKPKP